MNWGPAIDAFAAGCVLGELFVGTPLLYGCEHTQERLACLERLNGPFTPRFAAAVESIRPKTFIAHSPPKVDFTAFPLPINVNLSLEERKALNRVGSVASLFVRSTTCLNHVDTSDNHGN
jgi:hypothetical protein